MPDSLTVLRATRGWGLALAVGVAAALLLVLMARSVIGHAVHYDELLHILSARGVLQTGLPTIADGLYPRAELYTRATAWSLGHFGDNLVAARLPALVAGAVLVLLVGLWVVRRAGVLTGATAAVLLCIVPSTVDVAVFARFYTVHAVLMLMLFILAFEAMQPGRAAWVRFALAVSAVAVSGLGLHFQDTTIIAAGAVVAAVVALAVYDHWAAVEMHVRRRPIVTVVVLGMAALSGLVAVERLGLLDQLGTLALWASGNAKRYQFYLVAFRKDLPLLWPLLPVAATLALARPAPRRLAIFCVVAVACGLLVHSVAAQKSVRYVYYLVPLLCVLWALGLANVMAIVADRTLSSGKRELSRRVVAAWALLAAAFLLSQEGARALNLLAARDGNPEDRPYADEPDWTPLIAELGPRARAAGYLLTSNSMKALYYLGRYDYELNATIVPETDTREEFGRDLRTGRRAIGKAESVRRVLSEPGDGLVVIEASKIGRASGVNREAFAVIESRCVELQLPASTGVRAWWCPAP